MHDGQEPTAGISYGCVFCMTGHETAVAKDIEARWAGAQACAVSVVKRRSSGGVKSAQAEIVFKGYVFFSAPFEFRPTDYPDYGLKLLTTQDDDWRLTGHDAWFAEWVLSQHGEIGLSKARKVGDRVQIQQGPLKDLEGSIVRIDRRNKSGQVELYVNGRVFKVWLGFEWLDDTDLTRTEWQEKTERILSG